MPLLRRLLPACLVALAAAAGCSKPDGLNRGGKVAGTVKANGEPVPGGTIQFFSPDGQHAPQVNVKPDGTYLLQPPTLGPCRVVLRTSHLKHLAGKPRLKSRPGDITVLDEDTAVGYVKVPPEYEDPARKPLSFDVSPGDSTFDVSLDVPR